MAPKLNVMTSHARLRSYCVQVEAGLSAIAELASRVDEWVALKQAVVDHRLLAETGNDALTRSRAVNRVKDTRWDAGYTEGAGIAYLLSGKKASNEPYATVFRVPSRRATSLGHAKATEVGERAIAEARRVKNPMLDEWAARFETINAELAASGKAMEAAEDSLDDPRFGKRALVRRINQAIATTEAFILMQFPGQGALADALLVPSWVRRGGKPAPDPETDEPLGGDEPGADDGDVPV